MQSLSRFLLFIILFIPAFSFADEGGNLKEILESVQNLSGQIQELEGQAKSAQSESEKDELVNRAIKLRQEKRLDFKKLTDAEGFLKELSAEEKSSISKLIKEDYTTSQKQFSDKNREVNALRKSIETEDDAKVISELEDKVDVKKKELVELLTVSSSNLSSLEKLEHPATPNLRKKFEIELEKNARGVSSVLSALLEKRSQIKERPVSTDGEKAQRNSDKVRINDRIDRASADLKIIIALLKTNEKDATSYQQLLIESTGTITSDVFDKDVSIGLAQKWIKRGEEWLLEKLPTVLFKIFLFLFIVLIAKILSSLSRKFTKRWFAKTSLSGLAKEFLSNAVGRVIFAIGVLFGLSQLGLDVTALVAGFGVAGIVVGFALQDTLSNFASGLMILFYRPFDTGDLIRAAEVEGVVNKMTLVSTEILTLDNQRFVIPNNKIWQNVIQNVTAEAKRRVDFVFGVGYEDDLQKAESILEEIVLAEPHILTDPEPLVRVHELADSSVNFVVRIWVNTDNYWDAYWNVTRAVKDRFDEEGISIPYPQTDVHIHRPDGN